MKKKIPSWAPTLIWILGIFFTAFFLGELIGVYIEYKMTIPPEIVLAKEEAVQKARKKTLVEYERDIIPMFDRGKTGKPTSASDDKKKEGESDPEAPVNRINWDEEFSSGGERIQLKGTIIGTDTAVAFVQVSGVDIVLHIGQQVGSYQVDRINKNTIQFKKGETSALVSMNLEGSPVIAGHTISPVLKNRIGRKKKDGVQNVVTRSGNKLIVDRREFNNLLKPPSKLAHSIKFIPHAKDGKPYGIKISYLRGGSFFSKLDMKAGDVLIRANNKDIRTVEDYSKTRLGGFTFIEIIVVVAILVLLASIIIVRYVGQVEQAKKDQAMVQLKEVEKALEIYKLNNGTYPTQEQGLKALVEKPEDDPIPRRWKKLLDSIPRDPWDNEFVYIIPGEHKDFDLFSRGPDKTEDSEDDIVNWKKETEEEETP